MPAPDIWIPASVGIGSNLDEPAEQVRIAMRGLAQLPETRLVDTSSLYLNPPMGPAEQPDYVNAVALLVTRLTARELLDCLQAQELAQGRDRENGQRWGPRRIDLDLLTYGNRRIEEPGLVVPHPGISERNFVLFPLKEICPHLTIPGRGPVSRLVADLEGAALEMLRLHPGAD